MWFKIFLFELAYRKKRPATYLYWFILFFMAFMAMSTDSVQIGGAVGLVKENAPATIAKMMVILSFFFMMITSAIMGVAVLRDYEHKTDSLVFSTPISKFDYLFGRFLGSFVVVIFAFTGMLVGFMLGEFMPWREADKLLPFNAWNYIHPFIYLILPNLFFSAAFFFISGALSRKMVMVYVQWIVIFAVYQVSVILSSEVDNQQLASLLDPFAYQTVQNATQYWTVAEQNSMTIPMEGTVFLNRLLWTGIGLLVLMGGYFAFSTNVVRRSLRKKKSKKNREITNTRIKIPVANYSFGFRTYALQIWRQSLFYFRYIVKGIPFIAICIFALFIFFVNSFYMGRVFGTYTYPTTYLVLELVQALTIFFVMILVFYSGELVWRERDVKIHLIKDALPMPDFIGLMSKFIGLIMVFAVMLLAMIGFGVLVQAGKGYYEFNIGLYVSTLFSQTFSILVMFSFLAFFIQVMVNNKFVGHAVIVIFFIATEVLETLGVEHSLFQFGSAELATYSEMNGYGHFFTRFNWFDLYWLAFSIFLFAISVVFAVRGSDAAMKWRWQVGKLRFGRPLMILTITSVLTFILSGCYIYYNTNVVNTYQNSDEAEAFQADYERTLKKYQFIPQPKITAMQMKVDLYPSERDYIAEGSYWLKNFEDKSISKIHVQLSRNSDINHEYVKLSRPSTIEDAYDEYQYYVHALNTPLAPGDSIELTFKMTLTSSGFKESGEDVGVVYNGSFINNSEFPQLGYDASFELASDNDRKDNDLKPRDRMLKRDDPRGLRTNFITDDSHGIRFEIVVGTQADQIAIAPGYLQREWEADGRRYFHYKMDQVMMPFFNVVSARYAKVSDQTTIPLTDSTDRDIQLEIYYHPGHEYNLESMMKGMKDSFAYFSRAFSPYQFRQMRILEFPRYSNFAQSFANTVPFSEGIGFMVKVEDDDDVDVTYFVTAHELAHQWWGHQLFPASVQGSAVLSETLSQYSALMVMKQEYPKEHLKEFLKEELNRYLTGRTQEQKKEMPLALAENQQYIHYGKGANIMYALQDYIGEDSINAALKRLVETWGYGTLERNGRYANTVDLLGYLKEVTPDSMQYVLADFFDKIILFENKVDEASYQVLDENTYEVVMKLNTKKQEADSLGNETQVPMNYWMDVGVYAEIEGDEKLIYLKKHYFNSEESEIRIQVDQEPSTVGIDPLNKLIDRNPEDNTKSPTRQDAS